MQAFRYLAFVILPFANFNFLGSYHFRKFSLEQFQIKPPFPDMVANGNKLFGICFIPNFDRNIKFGNWQHMLIHIQPRSGLGEQI